MIQKKIFISAVILFIISSIVPSLKARTWNVKAESTDKSRTLDWAVKNSSSGDVMRLDSGTHYLNDIIIRKKKLTISGMGPNKTVINFTSSGHYGFSIFRHSTVYFNNTILNRHEVENQHQH